MRRYFMLGVRIVIDKLKFLASGMEYTDEKGALTQRQVQVKKIFRSDDGCRYFSGFCFLRESHRTFRKERKVGFDFCGSVFIGHASFWRSNRLLYPTPSLHSDHHY